MSGEKTPIDPNDENYAKLVKCVVDKVSSESDGSRKVVSAKLISGTSQVITGIAYDLKLEITFDDGAVYEYIARLHDIPWLGSITVDRLYVDNMA
ncbi:MULTISPECIES: cystatin family protein [unclassified Luteibacter]|uniref:hypothetical protein n=1 Tax=Luteibacter sp. PvP019 TaxID=3156436 RepID=UPI0033950A49